MRTCSICGGGIVTYFLARVSNHYPQLKKIREDIIAQGHVFQTTISAATVEAEGGQIIARRIIRILGKLTQNASPAVIEDLMEDLQEKIEAHLTSINLVQKGFKDLRAGLLQVQY